MPPGLCYACAWMGVSPSAEGREGRERRRKEEKDFCFFAERKAWTQTLLRYLAAALPLFYELPYLRPSYYRALGGGCARTLPFITCTLPHITSSVFIWAF